MLLWSSIIKYQTNINNIKNFAKRKDKDLPKSLDNRRILSNIPVRCKLKESMLIAQIGDKLAKETIKHHPETHGFLPKRGVDTFMEELSKYVRGNKQQIQKIRIELMEQRIKEILKKN